MRRKVIQHYVDVLCHMAIGWRMGEDLEILADLPDGTIHVDLLTGNASHSSVGKLDLWIAREMQAWLKNRFESDRISEQHILAAEIHLTSKTDRIQTNRKRIVSFDWDCDSLISTDQKKYESHLREEHRWHNRIKQEPKA